MFHHVLIYVGEGPLAIAKPSCWMSVNRKLRNMNAAILSIWLPSFTLCSPRTSYAAMTRVPVNMIYVQIHGPAALILVNEPPLAAYAVEDRELLRAGLNAVEKRKISCLCKGSNAVVQLVPRLESCRPACDLGARSIRLYTRFHIFFCTLFSQKSIIYTITDFLDIIDHHNISKTKLCIRLLVKFLLSSAQSIELVPANRPKKQH
jgi:hypothetical protein